jgi:hypothetical protein
MPTADVCLLGKTKHTGKKTAMIPMANAPAIKAWRKSILLGLFLAVLMGIISLCTSLYI